MEKQYSQEFIDRFEKQQTDIQKLKTGFSDEKVGQLLENFKDNVVAQHATDSIKPLEIIADAGIGQPYKKMSDAVLYVCACPKLEKITEDKKFGLIAENDETNIVLEVADNELTPIASKQPYREIKVTVKDKATNLVLSRHFRLTKEGFGIADKLSGPMPMFTAKENCPMIKCDEAAKKVHFVDIDVLRVECDIFDESGNRLSYYNARRQKVMAESCKINLAKPEEVIKPVNEENYLEQPKMTPALREKRERILPMKEYALSDLNKLIPKAAKKTEKEQ
jgi:hypothetical protein